MQEVRGPLAFAHVWEQTNLSMSLEFKEGDQDFIGQVVTLYREESNVYAVLKLLDTDRELVVQIPEEGDTTLNFLPKVPVTAQLVRRPKLN